MLQCNIGANIDLDPHKFSQHPIKDKIVNRKLCCFISQINVDNNLSIGLIRSYSSYW